MASIERAGVRVLLYSIRGSFGWRGEEFLTHNEVVKRVNIHGNSNQPMAELRRLLKKAAREPRIGAAKGEFVVPNSFFEPFPDEILKAFSGK